LKFIDDRENAGIQIEFSEARMPRPHSSENYAALVLAQHIPTQECLGLIEAILPLGQR
jgi:hypothetical protein